jgi:cell division protease FtsH
MDFLKGFKEEFNSLNIYEILSDINDLEKKLLRDDSYILRKRKSKRFKRKKQKNLTFLEIAKILRKKLPLYVYGQEHVIKRIVNSFKNNLIKKRGPKATFLFMGPSSTGKTYLAEMMGKLLDGYKVKVFDMSQYTRADDGISLYGSDYKYSNSKPGMLTDFVLKNPKSIIVFDEIEKAHNNIQNAFLSIFNDGKMVDKCGWIIQNGKFIPFDGTKSKEDDDYSYFPQIQEVDFSETILIFTSNIGKDLYNSKYFWDIVKEDYDRAEHMIIESISKEIKYDENNKEVLAINPPFLSRLISGEILLFKKLQFQHLLKISQNAFKEYLGLIYKNYKLKVQNMDEFVLSLLILTFAPRVDVRRLKNKIATSFFDIVTDYVIEHDLNTDVQREIIIKFDKEVKNFFKEEIKPLIKDDILKYMFRKNLTLKIEKDLKFENNVFIYNIKKIYFEKVKNIKDFGEDGIIFEIPEVTFDDIAGHKKVKQKLKEIVNFLKAPKTLAKFNVDLPKGMILYGPPGTGKTMIAKALAHEAELPFLATTGTDLLNLKKIDKIFETAREYAPSIIFIDEIDAIGRRDKHENRDIFINKLLSKLDGFTKDEGVFVIGATNYLNQIDPAILRPGRLNLKFEIKNLDKEARKYFLEKIINSYDTDGKFDIEKLIIYTTGMSGAELDEVNRNIAIELIRRGEKILTENILIEIINTVKYGEKINYKDVSKTLEMTAIHESGHAVISKILKPDLKIEQITITPRDKSLGFVAYDKEDDFYKNVTLEDIKKDIQILLAGRFAQIKKYKINGIDSGAHNDLQKATHLAYLAIVEFGMDEEIGNINLSKFSEYMNDKIMERISAWIKEAEKNVKKLIDDNWDKIEKVADLLIEKETIEERELEKIIKT